MIPASKLLSANKTARWAPALVAVLGVGIMGLFWGGTKTPLAFEPDLIAVPIAAGGGSLWVQKHETTIEEWNRCFDDGGCEQRLRAPAGSAPYTYPATNISWQDAQAYLNWINSQTGQSYRLPTGAEWNAIAREVIPENPLPIFDDPALDWASTYSLEQSIDRTLRPTGSFSTTNAGIADLDGNVWEWTSECYNSETRGPDEAPCAAFLVGGEHMAVMSFLVRDPVRGGCAVGTPPAHLGFRLATDNPANRSTLWATLKERMLP